MEVLKMYKSKSVADFDFYYIYKDARSCGVFIGNFQQTFTHFSGVFIVGFEHANSNWYTVFNFPATTGL